MRNENQEKSAGAVLGSGKGGEGVGGILEPGWEATGTQQGDSNTKGNGAGSWAASHLLPFMRSTGESRAERSQASLNPNYPSIKPTAGMKFSKVPFLQEFLGFGSVVLQFQPQPGTGVLEMSEKPDGAQNLPPFPKSAPIPASPKICCHSCPSKNLLPFLHSQICCHSQICSPSCPPELEESFFTSLFFPAPGRKPVQLRWCQ